MGMFPTFFRISRERRNREPPVYVCSTFLIIFDQLMPIDSILDSKTFKMVTENVMESSIGNNATRNPPVCTMKIIPSISETTANCKDISGKTQPGTSGIGLLAELTFGLYAAVFWNV
ncbi:hypothetical protein T02_6701 [Trichinella nativa]|uniref:Uncharacterized protein n=1 Tax=Trichinella nativa TaxID=6335 RepID=A0A0V1L0X1_9BILA|nr:hypothetical protein T02_6701 [Trichinella nativa]